MPTKWLQKRAKGSKNEHGMPRRRASSGLVIAHLPSLPTKTCCCSACKCPPALRVGSIRRFFGSRFHGWQWRICLCQTRNSQNSRPDFVRPRGWWAYPSNRENLGGHEHPATHVHDPSIPQHPPAPRSRALFPSRSPSLSLCRS